MDLDAGSYPEFPTPEVEETEIFAYIGPDLVIRYNELMMRIIGIFLVVLGGLYFFNPKEEAVNNLDIVKLKASSIKRLPTADTSRAVTTHTIVAPSETQVQDENLAPESHVSELPDDEVAEVENDDDLAADADVPWEELKNGWREQLHTVLSDIDPENGEDIYSAYMTENNAYEAEMAKLELRDSDDVQTLMGQLESRHEERLKEILGKHYQEVTDQHQQYNSSIQSENRSGKYEVGVSL